MASFLFDRTAVSLGASGAVFGLFAVAVLLKIKFSFQKLVRFHFSWSTAGMLQALCAILWHFARAIHTTVNIDCRLGLPHDYWSL